MIAQLLALDYLSKIGLALLLSALVGYEREKHDKPAGMRTIMFICLGAALSIIFAQRLDVANQMIRIPAHFLTAIGFVGSGSIIVLNKRVEGITTAALLLPVTIIGFFCGMGEFILAIATCICVYTILKLKYIEPNGNGRNHHD
jgi:putative Mg2+ transporter-C (MgtC) family protein